MHLAEHGDDLACVGASLQGQDNVSHICQQQAAAAAAATTSSSSSNKQQQ
jgi:hypothetical protein